MALNENEQKALNLLLKNGYFNDEDSNIGRNILENSLSKLEEKLRKYGYTGPSLGHSAKFYPSYGQLAWAFNPEKVTAEQAKHLTDKWVAKKMQDL